MNEIMSVLVQMRDLRAPVCFGKEPELAANVLLGAKFINNYELIFFIERETTPVHLLVDAILGNNYETTAISILCQWEVTGKHLAVQSFLQHNTRLILLKLEQLSSR